MTTQMRLDALLRDFRDGDEHGWQVEFDWLWTHHRDRMDRLTTSVQETGIQTPILLGNDGRVWDGHHRIAVAHTLGLESVPVVMAPLRVGDRVRLWIGPPKRGGFRYGRVTGVDNLGHRGVQIQFDQPVNFTESCYATHEEVELVASPDGGEGQ